MRRVRQVHPLDFLPEDMGDYARRTSLRVLGSGLLGAALFGGLSMLSWSAADPSLMQAVDRPVSNWMGKPGAITADMLMQVLGFASLALIIPMAFLGLRLIREACWPHYRWKLVFWLAGLVLIAGATAHMPTVSQWPLQAGLGGAVGESLRKTMEYSLGSTLEMRLLIGSTLGITGFLLLKTAVGYGPRPSENDDEIYQRHSRSERGVAPEDDDLADEDDDRIGFVSLGALVHHWLAFQGMLVRTKTSLLQSFHDDPYKELREGRAALRRPGETQNNSVRLVDANEEDDEPLPSVVRGPLNSSQFSRNEPSRVSAQIGAVKPSKRAEREAQPSLLDEKGYMLPPLALLAEPSKAKAAPVNADALEQNARLLEGVLDDFGVKGDIAHVRPGPVVTLYELEPAPGIKSSRVIGLADDIARSMSAVAARVAVVSGRNAIGIELPNSRRETVLLRELLASEDFEKSKFKLPLCIGKTIGGEPVIADLARMPHLLVAGTTGSGKSVAINTMILSLLYRFTPEQCRLIMVDPKMLELSIYEGIPHLLTPVVTDPKKAVVALKWAVHEMEERYRKMSKVGVRNIDGFNARVAEVAARGETLTRTVQTGYDPETGEAIYEQEDMSLEPLPYIVVIVDEMADLMMVAGKDIEGAIQRLAQMARAAGIHLIMATQRPSVDVITGTIKANFPTRISFQVTSKIDSRTILGEMGAEQLLGQGDMLFMAGGGRISRVHGPFVADSEVEHIVQHLKTQGKPQYLEAVTRDTSVEDDSEGGNAQSGYGSDEGADLYDRAVSIVLRDGKASTSYVQRRLQIGYNRAASIIERMEREGIVGAANHAGKREILVRSQDDAA